MQIFRKKTDRKSAKRWLGKCAETALKALWLVAYPLAISAVICTGWYVVLFKHHIHFDDDIKDIATAAWIPTFGIIYALVAAVILNTVWSEYKEMRMAIKRYDLARFMELRDEDVSPLIHVTKTCRRSST